MLPYCLKCREKKDTKNQSAAKTNKGKLITLAKGSVYDTKKSDLSKNKKLDGY